MTKERKRREVTTLAVGEEEQDGGLPPGVGVKTIQTGEEAEDASARPRPAREDRRTSTVGEDGEDAGR